MNRQSSSRVVPCPVKARQRILHGGLLAAAVFSLLAVTATAQAYVGPGAGISLLGALWALIAVVGSAILYIILWPLRRMRKRRKQKEEADRLQKQQAESQKNSSSPRPADTDETEGRH